ncbi:MAG: type II CRISPR RNA-guided endonuclease Cas9, partial [Bacteroides sp.]|nr:type II CRISPR RNA-guided endonuclease Cas9 [Bacteroides sp.]
MKIILGLDLGAASIGWAIIGETENSTRIIALGSRVIPYEGTEGKDFSKGTGESRNTLRTRARTIRKKYDRYQQRRATLTDLLIKNGMMPGPELKKMAKMELWALRSRAATEEISKQELGRILLWLNQKRGYKSGKQDQENNKKETEYLAHIKNNYQLIKEQNLTIGQYFYLQLKADEYFRVKENIFPREAYIEEFERICQRQSGWLPETLKNEIRDRIIYYQRPLKSQKGLVSVCKFEGRWIEKRGEKIYVGPKVAPKSSPLFQVEKIWEAIHNIRITNRKGENYLLSTQQKQKLFDYLNEHPKLTATELFKIVGLSEKEYSTGKQLERGIQGNLTKVEIKKCLGTNPAYNRLLQFNLTLQEKDPPCYLYDKDTGEVLSEKREQVIDPGCEKEPFYQLWHTIYSLNDPQECLAVLQKNFGLDEETARSLASIDFTRQRFGNKSARLIRKILPYLMEGEEYTSAMSYAGHNHSNSLTSKENQNRLLQQTLSLLPKNSLRQPIVEKILNQMINLENSIIDAYSEKDASGKIIRYFRFDEIRIELARELKQSKEERNETDKNISKRERENETIKKSLAEYGLRATRNNILKWRLYHEINDHHTRLNAICIYCGNPISLTDTILGKEVEIEHIIPRSKLFDDSQSNKTLAHRKCNSTKGNQTAYDFMKSKPENVFEQYVERVNRLYQNQRSKRAKLLMSEENIPQDFIERQLRESQYIARKAREILQSICPQVWCTTGIVTAELRRLWGWDDVTINLQLPKYKALGLTEEETWTSEHGKHTHIKEKITGWSKRNDHRHHAIDALVIACTKQRFIQRFNTLNSSKTREDMEREITKRSVTYREKLSLLEKYIISQSPLSVPEVEKAVANILVSFKSGKKVAVAGTRKIGKRGDRKVVQTGIIVPRGALSEESVYGKIRVIGEKKKLKYLFQYPDLIVDPKIQALVKERLTTYAYTEKEALASLKKNPIYLNTDKTIALETAACYQEEYVIKYNIDTNFNKTDKVVDKGIRQILEKRLSNYDGKPKEAFRDVLQREQTVPW